MAQKKLDVVVDVSAMTIGDLEILDSFRTSPEEASMTDVNNLLDKVTPDVDVRSLPVTAFTQLVEAITSAINMGIEKSGEA